MPPRRRLRKKTKVQIQQLLHRSYYNPKKAEGYAGYDQLSRQVQKHGIRRRQVKEWLEKQPGYTLHKPVQRRFRRSRVIVDGLDEQWQSDLVDVQRMSGDNQGYKHWLTCIDVLSRYAWIRPIKNKTAPQIIQAFQSIFKEGRQPRVLQTDQGTEFLNRHVQAFLKSQGIRHFVTYSDPKAQIVERFHRTIKNRLWRYFTAQNTQKYVDVLPEFVTGYNQAYHRSIRRSPDSVTHENAQEVWHTLYDDDVKPTTRRRFRFRVGDQVRMSKLARAIKKGYLPNWMEEVFVIASHMQGTPPRYKLNEWDGDPIEGSFYEQELQRVTVRPEDSFRVEAIVKRLGMSSLPHPDSFYVRLPSNVVTPDQTNTAWDFVVPLPHPLNFPELDEWTVAVTSVFLPPLGKQTLFDNVFIYSDLVTGTLVGDIEAPLLCTVDVKAETLDGVVGGVVREPEQLMHCPLRVGYIESIRLMLRD
ncbi:hypothetical protein QZH41_007598 [Actinostola sp. cb2023]|nr:hypothetical protein QZH41_007598 [Actinostola sp. cb2023]